MNSNRPNLLTHRRDVLAIAGALGIALALAGAAGAQPAVEYGAIGAKAAAAAAAVKSQAAALVGKQDASPTTTAAAPSKAAAPKPTRAGAPAKKGTPPVAAPEAPPAPPAAPVCAGDLPPPVFVSVVAGKSTLLKLPAPITLRTLGDEHVAQARLLGPQTLYLLGIGVGSTNMILQDNSGRCTIVDIGVGMDPGELQAKLACCSPRKRASASLRPPIRWCSPAWCRTRRRSTRR